MKSYYIKDGMVVDCINNKVEKKDLFIKGGKFADCEKKEPLAEIISAKGKYIMPGLFDLRCHLSQPGVSFNKSVSTISKKAASGGFTSILAMPMLSSMADNPETIKYTQDSIISNCQVNIFLSGCLTIGSEGKKLAPLGSLQAAGIVAVTDCPNSPQNNQIFCKAAEYASMFKLPVIDMARDCSLSPEASAHESILSLKMGLKGFPRMAEELYVARSILLAKYTLARIHLTSLSSMGSVELIKQAKEEGVQISCDVTSNHLHCTEKCIQKFDSFSKTMPPFREEKDRKALIKGLKNNTIDAITSGHQPFSFDDKSREFDLAPSGTLGLENAFLQAMSVLNSSVNENLLFLAKAMSLNPSKILNKKPISFQKGTKADFFIYDNESETHFKRGTKGVGGSNFPFKSKKLRGKIHQTFINGEITYCNEKI